MPTYVYRREDGTTFELVQRITDDALTEDPGTGQAVERVISGGVGLQFKGTGFYLTDYARAGKTNGSDSGETAKESSEGKAEPKAESKSEGNAESKSEGKAESKTQTKSDTSSGPEKE